jgi:hypothetical protein
VVFFFLLSKATAVESVMDKCRALDVGDPRELSPGTLNMVQKLFANCCRIYLPKFVAGRTLGLMEIF